jgi:hypothetical protein
VDAALAQVAAGRPHADLAKVVHHYLERLDPDGSEPDPTDQRALSIVKHGDGSLTGRFDLDPVGGEKVQAVLESMAQADRPAGDTRSRARRLGDALVQWADNTLAAGDLPRLRGVRPHVALTVGLADLLDPATGGGAAELGFGATLSAARARWVACDADLTRIVLDPDGLPLDVGRTQRLVPPHLRRAGEQRDRHCVFPVATPPPTGARCTTSSRGCTAGTPAWTTRGCSANATTPRSTTASVWSEIARAGGTRSDRTAARSWLSGRRWPSRC